MGFVMSSPADGQIRAAFDSILFVGVVDRADAKRPTGQRR